MVFKGKRLAALFPACIAGNTINSHAGLTYGGLLTPSRAIAGDVAGALDAVNNYLASQGVNEVIYKPVPAIYHTVPAMEDLYHLWRTVNPAFVGRQISSTIDRDCRPRVFDIRRQGVRRAAEAGVFIEQSTDFAPFWDVLSSNLAERYGACPVHSLDEIMLLTERFPKNIRLYAARLDGRVIAGVVVYYTPMVAHTQYISASPEGKALGALDLLFEKIIGPSLEECRYFDFGTSTEERGHYLNESLLYQKEGFGGRATLYDIYRYTL